MNPSFLENAEAEGIDSPARAPLKALKLAK